MDDDYLNELKEEGCKLIKLSNELKFTYLNNANNSPLNSQLLNKWENNLSFPNAHVNNSSNTSLDNETLTNNLELAHNGLKADNKPQNENLLYILYNNYKLILKKYEELSEQKLSYIEGIKEYQYKLDNYNYTIQLQKKLLVENREKALHLNSLQNSLNTLKVELDMRGKDLDKLRSELHSRQVAVQAREAELDHRTHDLDTRDQELQELQRELADKAAQLQTRELELDARARELDLRASLDSQVSQPTDPDAVVRLKTTNY